MPHLPVDILAAKGSASTADYRRGGGDDIVHMQGENGGTGVRDAMVNTLFILQAFETPANDSVMEGLVPNPTCLFHAINTFMKLHHPAFLAWFLEARRLLHVCSFIRGKDAMKESSLYIELLQIPVERGCDVEDNAERL